MSIKTKIVGLLVIAALFFQFFCKSAIISNYVINKDFIAKTLCIKKDIPKNSCQGKCHLKTQLENINPFNTEFPVEKLKDINETQLFFQLTFSCNYISTFQSLLMFKRIYFKLSSFLLSLYHPPELV